MKKTATWGLLLTLLPLCAMASDFGRQDQNDHEEIQPGSQEDSIDPAVQFTQPQVVSQIEDHSPSPKSLTVGHIHYDQREHYTLVRKGPEEVDLHVMPQSPESRYDIFSGQAKKPTLIQKTGIGITPDLIDEHSNKSRHSFGSKDGRTHFSRDSSRKSSEEKYNMITRAPNQVDFVTMFQNYSVEKPHNLVPIQKAVGVFSQPSYGYKISEGFQADSVESRDGTMSFLPDYSSKPRKETIRKDSSFHEQESEGPAQPSRSLRDFCNKLLEKLQCQTFCRLGRAQEGYALNQDNSSEDSLQGSHSSKNASKCRTCCVFSGGMAAGAGLLTAGWVAHTADVMSRENLENLQNGCKAGWDNFASHPSFYVHAAKDGAMQIGSFIADKARVGEAYARSLPIAGNILSGCDQVGQCLPQFFLFVVVPMGLWRGLAKVVQVCKNRWKKTDAYPQSQDTSSHTMTPNHQNGVSNAYSYPRQAEFEYGSVSALSRKKDQ